MKLFSKLSKKEPKAGSPKYKSEQEIVLEIEDKLKDSETSSVRQQAYLNIAYYLGNQWLAYDKVTNRIVEPPKEPWQIRLVANRIQPIVRTEHAKLIKNKPIMWVVPASEEREDVDSAKASEKLVEWMEYELDLQKQDRENSLGGLLQGTHYVKPFWNPNKGEEIQDPETGDIMKTGDVDVDLAGIFDITTFPRHAKNKKEINAFVHDKLMNVKEIKDIYGVDVEPEENLIYSNIYDAQLNALNNTFGANQYQPVEDSARVREYWELPSKEYPKGRRVTIASGKLLHFIDDIGFGENDDSERELPLFEFRHIIVPGRFEGRSIVEDLIPVQREYNKSRSQIIEHKNLMGNPPWVTEQNSLIEDITDEPGQNIEYKRGTSAPYQATVKPVSSDQYKNLESCIDEMYFISGQQEVSHGSTPPGVTSGVAIGYLQEQDDSKLAPSISNFVDCKQGYMSYLLKMCKYKYTIPRTLRVIGRDNKVETLTFKGTDITSTTVRIVEGSMFEQTRSAKQQFVFDLINSGVLNAEMDKLLILEMLEIGSIDKLYDEYNIDRKKAEQEEDQWTLGDFESPQVREFQDHAKHIECHNKWRNSESYEGLSPELMQIVDEHVLMHQQYLTMQPQQQQMQNSERTPVSDLVNDLSLEEMEVLEQNPQLLDEYNNAGNI